MNHLLNQLGFKGNYRFMLAYSTSIMQCDFGYLPVKQINRRYVP